MQEDTFKSDGAFAPGAEAGGPGPASKPGSLAGIMEELGYACAANEKAFAEVLDVYKGAVDEQAVAEVLGMIARTRTGLEDPSGTQASLAAALGAVSLSDGPAAGGSWSVEVVLDGLNKAAPGLDWAKVAEAFDHDGFLLPDVPSFTLLIAMYKRGARDAPFPLTAVTGRVWANSAGQVSFLRWAVLVPPEVFTWAHCALKQPPLEGLHGGKPATGTPNQAWLCLGLLQTLCRLAEAGHASAVRAVLEGPAVACPELLVLGLAVVQTEWCLMQRELLERLLPVYVAGHPNSPLVLHQLWDLNKDAFVRGLAAAYDKDPASISRLLDVCQEVKGLSVVLELPSSVPFALDLAALAARREFLNLDKWLREHMAAGGMQAVDGALRFLNAKLAVERAATQPETLLPSLPVSKVPLSADALACFLRVLAPAAPALPPELTVEYKALLEAAEALHPGLAAATAAGGNEGAGEGVPVGESFPADVEEEANAFFQSIYNGAQSVDDAVGVLRRYKGSGEPREQVVFACMVHNLFDEYRFFPQYPDKELATTAVLFGALIHHQLITSISLGIALRYVLDALRKPLGSKMHEFAVTALAQFAADLRQWPQYCAQLLAVPHLREGHPQLAEQVERAYKAANEGVPGDGGAPPMPPAEADAAAQLEVAALLQSTGSNDAPLELKDLKEAFDAVGGAGDALADGASENITGAPDLPPLSQPIVAAFAAPPPVANGAVAGAVAKEEGSVGATIASASAMVTPVKQRSTGGSTGGSFAGMPSSTPSQVAPGLHFSVINAVTLEEAAQQVDFPVPDEANVDKVHFSINNLAANNLEGKARELTKSVPEQYWPWFSNYLVVKRAAQEPNFHVLYIDLLDRVGGKRLNEMVVRTTHKYVKVLLASERIKSQTSDRSLLKNLGSWLGKLTVKRNRPVLMNDLDVKGIVYNAYEQGKMIAVIPFVHKVLEPCAESRVFKPPNPWVMGILSLLAEIYALDKLKLNLKFEIEMLFKDVHMALNDVKPSDSLGSYKREMGPSNPDFSLPLPPAAPRELPSVPSDAVLPLPTPPAPSRPGEEAKLGMDLSQQPGPAVAPPEGLFANLHAYVQISPSLGPYADKLKRVVPVAVDRAICDIITPVVERSVTIACCTTKELVAKDYVLEPDEGRMRQAAHLMVSSLAGSLALVTCKEPLRLSLSNQLRQLLQQVLPQDPNFLETAVQQLTGDNLDLGCTIIEKAATDKAVREVDERLLPAYQARVKAKAAGQAFVDVAMLAGRFPSSLPDALRPKPGSASPAQQRVYEDFARIPRTPSPAQRATAFPAQQAPAALQDTAMALGQGPAAKEAQLLFPSEQAQMGDMLLQKFHMWLERVVQLASKEPSAHLSGLADGGELQAVVQAVTDPIKTGAQPEAVATGFARKIYTRLQEGALSRLLLTALVAALDVLRSNGLGKLPMDLTRWLCAEEDAKLNKDIAEALLRARLLHPPELDTSLAKMMGAGRGAATDLAVHLIQHCIVLEPVLSASDMFATLDVAARLAARSSGGGALLQLVEQARAASRLRPGGKLGMRAAAPPKPVDPPGLREQVAALFDEWARLIEDNPTDRLQQGFVNQLQQAGVLKGNEATDRFIRCMAELAVSHCLNSEAQQLPARPGGMSFVAVDAFVRLMTCLISTHGGGVQLLHKVLTLVIGVLLRDAEERGGAFNGRPYFRLLLGLLSELTPTDPADATGFAALATIAGALLALQPMRVPGFAFSWLELIAHRGLMPKLLLAPGHKGWPAFQRLLVALLRFLEPYLRNADLTDAVRLLYKGTLRVLLVLLHDFPEFLCEYHFQLCDVVPPSCIQMRNLILSAFPRNMRLPDPFTPNLKVDLLPEISQSPRFVPEPEQLLPKQLKAEVDAYLKSRSPPSFPATLKTRLMLPQHEAVASGTRYNSPLLNTLLSYVGIQAIQQLQASKQGGSPVLHGPAIEIFQRLAAELDTEGRYLFLNAIANQLRYPNNHTHYFSCVLLYLFAETGQEIVQEQITRVLLERLIVNRPHPWGLLITFIELIKNPRYNFWSHSFCRCAPEIERLFESVARSCMGPQGKGEDEGGLGLQQQLGEPVRG